MKKTIRDNSERICDLAYNHNTNSRDYILNLCAILWPGTDIYCLGSKALTPYRYLFYSIYAETLSKKETKLYRKYEGKTILQIKADLANLPEKERLIIINNRHQIMRQLSNSFTYLVSCFNNIRSQIQSEIDAFLVANDENIIGTNLEGSNHNTSITNKRTTSNIHINSYDHHDEEEKKSCGARWGKFRFDSDQLIIEWENIEDEITNDNWKTFRFACNDTNDDVADDNDVENESNDNGMFDLLGKPQRSIRTLRDGYLYLIAGGYINSPPYCKSGCSTANENTFFSRKNHYWVGSNPRYCFKSVIFLKSNIEYYYLQIQGLK
jgi:hypothetical protein